MILTFQTGAKSFIQRSKDLDVFLRSTQHQGIQITITAAEQEPVVEPVAKKPRQKELDQLDVDTVLMKLQQISITYHLTCLLSFIDYEPGINSVAVVRNNITPDSTLHWRLDSEGNIVKI